MNSSDLDGGAKNLHEEIEAMREDACFESADMLMSAVEESGPMRPMARMASSDYDYDEDENEMMNSEGSLEMR